MRLLLFDIDGTLIRSRGAGRKALVGALEAVFGTAGPIESYQMAGKTDPRIIHDLLSAAGLEETAIQAGLAQVYEQMIENGRRDFSQNGITPCAGVPELLTALHHRHDIVLGLLTGNISGTAPLKLAAAGINPTWFRVGAYGSDHIDRNQLPAIAMARAGELTRLSFKGNNTIIIGDTPADIACARAGGATAVAVASGSYSAATLERYRPDHLLDNLTDTAHLLKILV